MKAKTRREPFYYIRFPACFELLLYCLLFTVLYFSSSVNAPTRSFNFSACAASSSLLAELSSAIAVFSCTTAAI